jgi:hypothetical protein
LAYALLVRTRRDLQRQLAAAADERRALADRLAAVTAERDDLRATHEWFEAANARAVADADRQRERADELAARLDVLGTPAVAATVAPAAGGDGHDDGLWHLFLSHIARRWAAVVGVPPEGRAVTAATAYDQLTQALARETERLREEVGVEVELAAPEPSPAGAPTDPARVQPRSRVAELLAAVELLGVLAASAQRVTVERGDELVLTGEGWVDPNDELATVRERAMAAGTDIGPLDVDGDRVRVVVRATARQPGDQTGAGSGGTG